MKRRARGSIATRPTRPGLWLRWIDAKGARRLRRAKSDDPATAEAELADLLKVEDERRARVVPTLAEFVADDFLPTWRAEVAASTVERSLPQLDRIVQDLGELLVSEVTPAHVRAYVAGLTRRELSPGTIRREVAVLRTVFAMAEERGFVIRNAARTGRRGVKLAPVPARRPVIVSDAKRAEALAAVLPKYRDVLMLIQDTGLRRSTACELRWSHVAEDFTALVADPGANAKRKVPAVPLTERVRAMLRRRRRAARKSAVRVFPDVEGRAFTLHWRRLRKSLGLEGYRLHDWRHDVGSRLAQLGVPLTTVADLLGHADARLAATTYATSVPPQALRDAVRKLEPSRRGARRATPAGRKRGARRSSRRRGRS